MSLTFNFETALTTARTSVGSKVSPLPKDDVDLVEAGALDSMGWVDTLIGIESVTGIRDFGNPWPDDRPKSIRALADMICEAQKPASDEKPGERRIAGHQGESETLR